MRGAALTGGALTSGTGAGSAAGQAALTQALSVLALLARPKYGMGNLPSHIANTASLEAPRAIERRSKLDMRGTLGGSGAAAGALRRRLGRGDSPVSSATLLALTADLVQWEWAAAFGVLRR